MNLRGEKGGPETRPRGAAGWAAAELPGACHLRGPGWTGAAPLGAIKPRGVWEGPRRAGPRGKRGRSLE